MHLLYLSPGFPPTAWHFCAALRERGVRVSGIGDEPLEPGSAARLVLDDYVCEPRMEDYASLKQAVAGIVARNGAFDRVESNVEWWLEADAQLRADFGVQGLQPDELRMQRSKYAMAQLFTQSGIPYPAIIRANDAHAVRSFAVEHGFPLVFKPDIGAGAVNTFSVANDEELGAALAHPLDNHVVQPFVRGDIVTYDGLTDREGRILFATSHVYDVGIMQLRQATGHDGAGHDGHYYSLRTVPPALARLGERAVRAFDVRERFFHIEFFACPDGSYVALEMNLRPPGGYTTELMNYAAGIDVYALWADVVTGHPAQNFRYHAAYHTAHAGRRRERHYRLSDAELRRELGDTLVAVEPVVASSADTMGDDAYLLRHPDLSALKAAIALVHAV